MAVPLVLDKIFAQNLKDISLEVNDGEIVAIIGPEGGGKDELFRAITGERAVDSGKIILNGDIVKTGTIFEDYSIYKRRVRKGLYIFAYRRWLKRVDDKKLAIVSEMMNIDRDFLLSPSPRGLSKGERKKFDLDRYLITKRKLILLDDPLIGLDWPARKTTIGHLKEIVKAFDQPCLYKANSEEELKELNGRVTLIRNGRLEYCGEWQPGLNF